MGALQARLVFAALLGITAAISYNALYLQDGLHPAPISSEKRAAERARATVTPAAKRRPKAPAVANARKAQASSPDTVRAIQRELPPSQALYRSSEEFTSEVTSAMRNGRMQDIRHRYRRSLNVLILEDVQFFSGKRATQIELFHTIEHLITRGKTVVLSADRPLREIEKLDRKLASRMVSGLVASIAPPELATRTAILRDKAAGGFP